jgi:hypothetical protein
MPVLVSLGGGIVAKRVVDGRDVMLMRPSWTPGTATRIEGCVGLVGGAELSSVGDGGGGMWHIAKEQKFSALTSKLCSSQGCLLSVVASSMGRTLEKVFSSASRSCHTRSLLSRPCLWASQSYGSAHCGIHAHPRDDVLLVYPPTRDPKNRSLMSFPDSYRSFDGEIPQNDPAVSVSGE